MKTQVSTYTYSISAMLGLLLFGATSASAALVSFSTADYADGGISTSGTLVGALNGTTVETVNTVDFAALGADAGTNTFSGGETATIFGGLHNTGANGTAGALTLGGVWSAGGNGNIHFAGLTDTQEYEVQFVFSDDRAVLSGGTSTSMINIWGNVDGSGAADLTIVEILNDAQIVTGTFTADATTQDFYVGQVTNVGSFDGYVGALQIRAIPEPGTLGLVATFGGAVLFIRRKMMI